MLAEQHSRVSPNLAPTTESTHARPPRPSCARPRSRARPTAAPRLRAPCALRPRVRVGGCLPDKVRAADELAPLAPALVDSDAYVGPVRRRRLGQRSLRLRLGFAWRRRRGRRAALRPCRRVWRAGRRGCACAGCVVQRVRADWSTHAACCKKIRAKMTRTRFENGVADVILK